VRERERERERERVKAATGTSHYNGTQKLKENFAMNSDNITVLE